MEKQIKKNEEYVVDIVDNGSEGEGIAKIKDFIIFIPGVIKGEKVKVLIVKVLSSYGYGKVLEILKKSDDRIDEECKTYKRCGGCSLRHMKYEKTLEIKKNNVQNLINKGLKSKVKINEIVGMNNPYYYRNKLQYPFGIDKTGNKIMGVFANRTHDVIETKECMIQNKLLQEIAEYIFQFVLMKNINIYNEKDRSGILRHIVLKIGVKTDEVMCILVINNKEMPYEKELVNELTNKYKQIKSIVKNINMKNTNVILGKENVNLYGNGYIEDILEEYRFRISPLSFYQINPIQAEKLYNLAVEEAKINKKDIVFDLYCGIGTISIFMAKYAKKVYGIEIVEEAIKNAKENAILNNIKNTEFLVGDVEKVLDDLINNKKIIPDIIMFDPPRKGLDNKTIENVLEILPKKLVYISCNPATLVRDLAKFEEKYDIENIKLVDMFPYTTHVECISALSLKKSL